MQLQRDSGIPLHEQLKTILRLNVETGEWQPGRKLPSEPELSQTLGIARGTVRSAISELVLQGLLESRQGDGTYVSSRKIEQNLMSFYSFAREAAERGLEISSRVLEWAEPVATEGLRQQLALDSGDRVLRVTRIRLLAEEPIVIETCYIPAKYAASLREEDFTRGALYDVLQERCGLNIVKADETFEASLLSEYEAELLGVAPGSPALSVERLAYTAGDRPIEFRRGIIRGDRCRYHVELR
jgi:GntR family transcriptional regulator